MPGGLGQHFPLQDHKGRKEGRGGGSLWNLEKRKLMFTLLLARILKPFRNKSLSVCPAFYREKPSANWKIARGEVSNLKGWEAPQRPWLARRSVAGWRRRHIYVFSSWQTMGLHVIIIAPVCAVEWRSKPASFCLGMFRLSLGFAF